MCFKLNTDLSLNYNLVQKNYINQDRKEHPLLPQDYIMDFKEEGRYGARAGPYYSQYSGHDGTNGDDIVSYPKLRQLLDLKTRLIE